MADEVVREINFWLKNQLRIGRYSKLSQLLSDNPTTRLPNRLLFPRRQFAVLWQLVGFRVPTGAGVPEDILLRPDARIVVQSAGRDHYVFAAFNVPGKGGAAIPAKAGGKIFAVR